MATIKSGASQSTENTSTTASVSSPQTVILTAASPWASITFDTSDFSNETADQSTTIEATSNNGRITLDLNSAYAAYKAKFPTSSGNTTSITYTSVSIKNGGSVYTNALASGNEIAFIGYNSTNIIPDKTQIYYVPPGSDNYNPYSTVIELYMNIPGQSTWSQMLIYIKGNIFNLNSSNATLKSAWTAASAYVANNVSDFLFSTTAVSGKDVVATFICFLEGSMIRTPSGLTAVEDLSVGDEVVTFVEGAESTRRLSWAGHAHCVAKPHLPLDQAGYPVRILKDAISEGVPFKDMLITAEHCLFFDGNFVPARMLVNGRSIFFDRSITSYDYYHIETEEHSVIMADGMLTESYLDTGNRRAFRTNDAVIRGLFSSSKDWKTDAAAPLDTSRETVEPLFRQIEARSAQVDGARQTEVRPLTDDSNLHLVTETGAVIRPTRESSGRVMFRLPPDIQSVRIVSSVSRPCDVVGPFVDDRRTLGVLVGEVTLFESDTTRTLTTHLHSDSLPGWNTVEGGTMRWTAGNALLPLGQRSPGSLAMMAIEVKVAGPYLFNDTLPEQQTRHA